MERRSATLSRLRARPRWDTRREQTFEVEIDDFSGAQYAYQLVTREATEAGERAVQAESLRIGGVTVFSAADGMARDAESPGGRYARRLIEKPVAVLPLFNDLKNVIDGFEELMVEGGRVNTCKATSWTRRPRTPSSPAARALANPRSWRS